MNSGRVIIGLGALIALSTGCAGEAGNSAAEDPAVAFENLTVASGFTFATRQEVRLRLQATDPGVGKYIEISDDEGRRLFAGVYSETSTSTFASLLDPPSTFESDVALKP